MLESPDLRQLRQRIGVRWRLASLSRDETSNYVRHRLRISADAERDHIFSDAALGEVFRFSGGVPRLVNLVCDRALLAAFSERRAAGRRRRREARGDRAARRRCGCAQREATRATLARRRGDGARDSDRRALRVRRSARDRGSVSASRQRPSPSPSPRRRRKSSRSRYPTSRRRRRRARSCERAAEAPPAPTPEIPRVDDLARALALRSPGATAAARTPRSCRLGRCPPTIPVRS